jgi:hypothetical protein
MSDKPHNRLGATGVRGELHPLAKLTVDRVRFIRRSAEGLATLARKFKVAHGAIWKARNRISWGWLED